MVPLDQLGLGSSGAGPLDPVPESSQEPADKRKKEKEVKVVVGFMIPHSPTRGFNNHSVVPP